MHVGPKSLSDQAAHERGDLEPFAKVERREHPVVGDAGRSIPAGARAPACLVAGGRRRHGPCLLYTSDA
ncbi:MAG: hypothetical protein QUU85_18205, partial [Candidatus Eisenbacteria bacterium]|nr:hypothetical protein [Candidatus Eisenbacteria bacterium]